MKDLICPISSERIDNNISRLTVFISVVFMMAFIISGESIFMIIATFDTMVRAMINARYSPLKLVSTFIIHQASLEKKPINLGKKVFASRLGMICGILSIVLFYFNFEVASLIVAGFWMVLAILDSVFDVCLGCYIYTYLVYPFYHRTN